MSAKKKDVTECLDALFKQLYKAKLAPETLLKSEAQREHYESLLMFAFRKLQAARYHRKRVDALMAEHHNELVQMEAVSKPEEHKLKGLTVKASFSRSRSELTFDLCAFFAAIRSGIDFLARTCAQHIKGVEADSVTTMLKLVNDGKTGPLLKIIADNAQWLVWLRDYRDYLVHRLVIQATSGGQIQWKEGKSTTTLYPIVVPADTPKHVPDTRRVRALDEPESRFNVATSEAYFTDPEGNKHWIEHSVTMEPTEGYIRIEVLMERELVAFEALFISIVEALAKLDFAPTPLEKTVSKASV